MDVSKYQLKSSCAAVPDRDKVIQLPVGSLIFPTSTTPDAGGVIQGICDGYAVGMFACDLEERAERTQVRKPRATAHSMRSRR